MIAYIQPPALMMPQSKEQVFCEKYVSRSKADARASQINGVVIKEQGQEIYWVFKTVPTQTVGFIEED